eukprot:GHVT01031281.1.p1 GENE.GHVT01031281.1~~GHVT01031281.1.p1  ORF type:complete len:270 (-),score=31.86 GHVT01031281.1:302-1111(-)
MALANGNLNTKEKEKLADAGMTAQIAFEKQIKNVEQKIKEQMRPKTRADSGFFSEPTPPKQLALDSQGATAAEVPQDTIEELRELLENKEMARTNAQRNYEDSVKNVLDEKQKKAMLAEHLKILAGIDAEREAIGDKIDALVQSGDQATAGSSDTTLHEKLAVSSQKATAAKGVTDSVNQMRNELDSLVHAGLNDAVQQVVNKRSKPGDRNIELQKSHDTIRTPPKEERKKVKSEIARRISSAKVPDHQRPSSASTTTSSGFRKPPAGK